MMGHMSHNAVHQFSPILDFLQFDIFPKETKHSVMHHWPLHIFQRHLHRQIYSLFGFNIIWTLATLNHLQTWATPATRYDRWFHERKPDRSIWGTTLAHQKHIYIDQQQCNKQKVKQQAATVCLILFWFVLVWIWRKESNRSRSSTALH